MNKYEAFLLAYKSELVYSRAWLLRAFSAPLSPKTFETKECSYCNSTTDHVNKKQYTICSSCGFNDDKDTKTGNVYFNGKDTYFVKVSESEHVKIDDANGKDPLYGVTEKVTAKANDFLIVKSDTDTYYSTLISNLLIYEFAFGDKIPYHNDRFTSKLIDRTCSKAMKDGTITVPEYRKHTRGHYMLNIFSDMLVPAASERTVIPPSKTIQQKRKALLEQYKDKLDDPATIAHIEKELVELYREYIKEDRSDEFFISDKAYVVNAKRMYLLFGGEPRIEDTSKFDLAVNSLEEGWDIKDLPMMVNSLRMGVFNRGSETALGGEAAKFSARIFQNTKIDQMDCKVKFGYDVLITPFNKDAFVGRWEINGGNLREVTAGTLDGKIGKRIELRSPLTCQSSAGNYCAICMGRQVHESKIGLGTQASNIGSNLLKLFLSLMHGRKLETKTLDIQAVIE